MTVRSVVRGVVRGVARDVVSAPDGRELVANGSFSSGSGWTLGTGWSIAGGVAKSDGSGGATDYIGRALLASVSTGQTIRWRVTLTNEGAAPETSSGTVLEIAEDAIGNGVTTVIDLAGQPAGTYSGTFIHTGPPASFVVFSYRTVACGIDNLSIIA